MTLDVAVNARRRLASLALRPRHVSRLLQVRRPVATDKARQPRRTQNILHTVAVRCAHRLHDRLLAGPRMRFERRSPAVAQVSPVKHSMHSASPPAPRSRTRNRRRSARRGTTQGSIHTECGALCTLPTRISPRAGRGIRQQGLQTEASRGTGSPRNTPTPPLDPPA